MYDLDIPDDCWEEPSGGELRRGDVCEAVPLAILVDDRIDQVHTLGEDDERTMFVPALYSYALVLGVLGGYAVVSAIGTIDSVPDQAAFPRLLEKGRTAKTFARIPLIPDDRFGSWQEHDALAFFTHVETFPSDELASLRVTSMTSFARDILGRRVKGLVVDS